MPARKATASGKWSQSIWDVTPGVGDDVFANNFTIEIDQNVNVGSLRTAVSGVYAAAGGGFTLYQPLSVIASSNGFLGGTTSCLTSYVSAGTATLSGNVTGGSAAAAYGVNNNGAGNVNIFGNVLAGSNTTAYGSINSSTGNITIVGNVSGSSSSTGLYHNSNGNCYVFGEVRPGAGTTASFGIGNYSVGNVYVTGNVIAGALANSNSAIINNSNGAVLVVGNVSGNATGTWAINNSSTGTLLVSGTITASANANTVVSSNIAARNEFTGSLVNGDGGRQAVYCAKYLVHPKMFDSSTQHKNTEIGNYVTYSEQLDNAAWTKFQTTVTANLTTSPFGATVADKISETTVAGMHICYTTLSNINYTTPQVFSVYLKSAGRQYVTLANESGNGINGYSVMYNLTNGTMLSSKNTGTGVLSMSSIENVGDGWYRCALGGTLTTGFGAFNNVIGISDRANYSGTLINNHYASYTGNALSGIYAYGAQFEYGTTPSAYLSSTNTLGYKNVSAQPVTFYAPEAYSSTYVPHTSSVSLGTAYAAVSTLSGVVVNIPVQLSGTMIVPSISSVALGTLVGSASGVAILNSANLLKVWETNINTLTAANSLGLRLKNAATIQEIGQQIQNINL